MIRLSQQDKEDLILIQPYYSQKQQSREIEISINSMMKLRKQAGLQEKPKGRPTGTGIVFKDEETIPGVIVEAKDRLRRSIKIQKVLTSLRTEEGKQLFSNELIGKTNSEIDAIIEKYKELKDMLNDPSRAQEFITK